MVMPLHLSCKVKSYKKTLMKIIKNKEKIKIKVWLKVQWDKQSIFKINSHQIYQIKLCLNN